jgi:hypothetical protein
MMGDFFNKNCNLKKKTKILRCVGKKIIFWG